MAGVAFGPLGPMVARAPVRSMTFAGVPLDLKIEFFASPAAAGVRCAFRSGSGSSFKVGW